MKQPLFFDWNTPWLPRLATYLLSTWNEGESTPREDLSTTVVVLSGRRAGRRLLELLALEVEKEKIAGFVPPRIVTLREAVTLLLPPKEKSEPEASEWTSWLAWREAFEQLPEHLLQSIQPCSQEVLLHHRGEHLLGLVASLAQELGSVGLDFKTVTARIGALFPETAEREEPRWQALAHLQESYRNLLASWGYADPNDLLVTCLEHGIALDGLRLLVIGVVDSPPLFKPFFEKMDPTVIVIAPQKHAAGFTKHGMLVASYWLEHPACVEEAQLITCERSEDQAAAVVRILAPLKHHAKKIAIALPDPTTLPLLQDRLKQYGMETRHAAGLPFLGGRLYQLLQALAHFFEHNNHLTPSLQAVGALVRHPDIHLHCSDPEGFLKQLEALEQEHLPAFLDKASLALFKKNRALVAWIEELEKLIGAYPKPCSLLECVLELRGLLLRILGQRQVRSDTWEGHYFLGSLEHLLLALEEIEVVAPAVSSLFSMHTFIKNLLELLSEKRIPEREEPETLELLGWLEMHADDSPYAIITSCHEGSLPSGQARNPFLPESLRKIVGLAEESTLLARDHYLLQSIMASRDTILIAPRHDGRGEPVRPSRLLMLGAALEKLPQRVLRLTQRRALDEEKEIAVSRSSGFCARPVGEETVTHVTVTGLRTYLQSPRLFYLQHVLKLREFEELPLEMHAGHFGMLVHEVLGAFGAEEKIRSQTDPKKIAAWLRKKLFTIAASHFAPGPTVPIALQLEEAAETLDGFAVAQAAHCRAGWKIIAAENRGDLTPQVLEEKIILPDGRFLMLQGRIDRIDWHSEEKRWMIIDYKTRHDQDWKQATPNREHFQKKGEEIFWKDLQLPLYLKLVPHWEPLQKSGLPLPTLETTDLCYFQLPVEPTKSSLSEPFNPDMIIPAWEEAARLMREIVDGNFEALGEIDPTRMPTLAALCGISALS